MESFAGTIALLRLALRRDRIVLPSWIFVYLLYSVGGTTAAVALYPDAQSRLRAAATVNEMPAMLLMYGRIWDPTSLGSVAMMKPIGFGGVFAAVLAILFMTRHTRSEEEAGRLELLGSLVVGRFAPLAASMGLMLGVMTFICLANGLGVAAAGLPVGSTWAWALSLSLAGLTFAAIAGLTAQLSQSARTANGIAFGVLIGSVLLRGTADIAGADTASSAWWTWLSPIGWQEQVKAFAGDHAAALVPFIVSTIVLLLCAFALIERRDLDAGFIPQRDGRARAQAWLNSPLALAFRIQRGLLLGIVLAYSLLSALLGAFVSQAHSFLDNPEMLKWLEAITGSSDPYTVFMVFELGFTAFITATCAIVFARRLGIEEQSGRLEPLLATAISHRRLFGAYVLIATLATIALQLLTGVGFWLANGIQTGVFGSLPQALSITLVYLPAIWVLMSFTFVLLAFAPTLTSMGWVALGACLLIAELGEMFHWPAAIQNLSPFTHVPRVPVDPMAWTPELLLTGLAAVLIGAAFVRFQHRDLATP